MSYFGRALSTSLTLLVSSLFVAGCDWGRDQGVVENPGGGVGPGVGGDTGVEVRKPPIVHERVEIVEVAPIGPDTGTTGTDTGSTGTQTGSTGTQTGSSDTQSGDTGTPDAVTEVPAQPAKTPAGSTKPGAGQTQSGTAASGTASGGQQGTAGGNDQ